jgi:hypothetical protein
MKKQYLYIAGGIGGTLMVVSLILALRGGATETPAPSTSVPGFGVGDNRSVTVAPSTPTEQNAPAQPTAASGQQTIFQIASGAVAGATLIDLVGPVATTTVARYVKQENGHVFEVSLDVPGALPRTLSNTTIPGVNQALWVGERGSGVILQYLSAGIIKSVYLGFAPATTTATTTPSSRPNKIQFLPDNLRGLAVSPNGARIAYLLQTSGGVAGYTAASDGSGSTQLFSLPLAQVTLTWPSANALLIVTKSARGVPGMAFSINTSSGLVTALMRAEGLTATANSAFSHLMYQIIPSAAATPASYARSIQTGREYQLRFAPYPDKCVWGVVATTTLYCASPIQEAPVNYLDLWHMGAGSMPDSIFVYDLEVGDEMLLALPGSVDGGGSSDIVELELSTFERYLGFIDRSSRTFWGIKLEE